MKDTLIIIAVLFSMSLCAQTVEQLQGKWIISEIVVIDQENIQIKKEIEKPCFEKNYFEFVNTNFTMVAYTGTNCEIHKEIKHSINLIGNTIIFTANGNKRKIEISLIDNKKLKMTPIINNSKLMSFILSKV